MEEEIKFGIYRHFKGNHYYVYNIVKHSETEEDLVLYQKLYDDKSHWVRPLDLFLTPKIIDNKEISRFTYIEEFDPNKKYNNQLIK